jgi:hypothetical protein
MSTKATPFAKSTWVLCKHGNYYYEAKIIKAELKKDEWVYRIHYKNWGNRYDENVKHSDAKERFMAHTPENVARTKKQIEIALANEQKEKRKPTNVEVGEEVASSSVSGSHDNRPKIQKPLIPASVMKMLQTVQSVPNLEEKTSVESFLKKYMEEKKGFEKLCPGHPAADAMIECFLEQLKLDFNMNLMVYLKKEEMKQCLEIFNTKRAAKDETEVTMEEMTELYEKEENRMKLFENPGINFADIYGVLHFARILQSGYDDYEDELPVGDNLPIMLIHDLLSYAENFTSEYA